MAQEKARSSRARTTEANAETTSTPARATRAGTKTGKGPAKKPAAPRTRKKAASAEPSPEAIAFHAYLLWERGEPGDPDEHWLRAERELTAA